MKDYLHPLADHNVSLRNRAFFFFILFLLITPGLSLAETETETSLTVTVDGVKGRLYDNVMARLRIHRFSQNSELSETEIRRLHRLAESDIKASLAPFGYYSVNVKSELQNSDLGWQAFYHITAGDPVLLNSMSIGVVGEGAELAELSDTERFFDLVKGTALRQANYETGKRDLLSHTRALGFLDAVYTVHEIRIDRESYVAEIELVLDTGQRLSLIHI